MVIKTHEGGCAIALNIKDLDGAKTRTLIKEPRHILRRAKKKEIEKLIEPLDRMLPALISPEALYEADYTKNQDSENPGTVHWKPFELDEANWKYFIIEYKRGQNQPIINLDKALLLLDKEILLGPQKLGGGITWNPEIHFLQGTAPFFRDDFFLSITQGDASLIRKTYGLLINHDNAVFDIQSRINQLIQLYRIPLNSPLRILGYFTIIESILTHKPDQNDRFDSITKQIKRNFNLLNNRFKNAIIYKEYFNFDSLGYNKMWAGLYNIRSTIAHGGKLDFKHNKFVNFKNNENVIFFLHKVVKKILFQSLLEPKLIRDLK